MLKLHYELVNNTEVPIILRHTTGPMLQETDQQEKTLDNELAPMTSDVDALKNSIK